MHQYSGLKKQDEYPNMFKSYTIPIGCLSFLRKAVFNHVDIGNNSLQHLSPSLRRFESFKKKSFFNFTRVTFYQHFTYVLLIYLYQPMTEKKIQKHINQFLGYTLTVFWSQKSSLEVLILFINSTPLIVYYSANNFSFKSLKKL